MTSPRGRSFILPGARCYFAASRSGAPGSAAPLTTGRFAASQASMSPSRCQSRLKPCARRVSAAIAVRRR